MVMFSFASYFIMWGCHTPVLLFPLQPLGVSVRSQNMLSSHWVALFCQTFSCLPEQAAPIALRERQDLTP